MSTQLKMRLGAACLVLASLMLLAFVIAGPFVSLNGIRNSLDNNEVDQLACYIDFPELQDNLKIEISRQAEDTLGLDFSDKGNVLAQFARQFSNSIIDIAVENAVSPAGIAMILSGKDLEEFILDPGKPESVQETPRNKKNSLQILKDSQFQYIDHKRFIFFLPPPEDKAENPGQLVFYRKGIFWKLSEVKFAQ